MNNPRLEPSDYPWIIFTRGEHMELVTYLINTLASNPEIFFLLIGLMLVSIAGILIHIPASKVEMTNDRYCPKEAVTNVKRQSRHYK